MFSTGINIFSNIQLHSVSLSLQHLHYVRKLYVCNSNCPVAVAYLKSPCLYVLWRQEKYESKYKIFGELCFKSKPNKGYSCVIMFWVYPNMPLPWSPWLFLFFSLSLALSFTWHVCVSMLSVSTLVGTLEVWCSIYVAEITGWHTPAAHFPHHLRVFLKSSSSSPSLPDHIALLTVALFSSSSMFRTSWCLPFALLSSSPKSSVCHPVARGCFGNSLWLGETNWIVIQTGNTHLPDYSLTSCLASSCARKAQ